MVNHHGFTIVYYMKNYTSFQLPDELINFISKLASFYKPETILDPACGQGTLLNSLSCPGKRCGIDNSKQTIAAASSNYPSIEFNTSNFLDREFHAKYDMIVSCFPLEIVRSPGILVESKYKVKGRVPLSLLFLEKTLSLLAPGGVLICIMPQSISTSYRFEGIRSEIVNSLTLKLVLEVGNDNKIFSDIHLRFVFVLLVIENVSPKTNSRTFIARSSSLDDLILLEYLHHKGNMWIKQNTLGERWDFNYYLPEYQELSKMLDLQNSRPLGEIAEIFHGIRLSDNSNRLSLKGEFLILKGVNLRKEGIVFSSRDEYSQNRKLQGDLFFLGELRGEFLRARLIPGDVIIRSFFQNDPVIYIYRETDPPCIATQNIIVVRSESNPYIAMCLKTTTMRNKILMQVKQQRRGLVLSISDIKKIRLPLLLAPENRNSLANRAIPPKERFDMLAGDLLTDLKKKKWEVETERIINPKIQLDFLLSFRGRVLSFLEIIPKGKRIEEFIKQVPLIREFHNVSMCFIIKDTDLFCYGEDLRVIAEFPSPEEFLLNAVEPERRVQAPNLMSMRNELMSCFKSLEGKINTMGDEMKDIKREVREVKDNVQVVLDNIIALQDQFSEIKTKNYPLEECIQKLSNILDNARQDLSIFIEKAKKLVKAWDNLHDFSKLFLPSAEYLMTQLNAIPDIDYSPAILQYCRTIENELLQKIFLKFLETICDSIPLSQDKGKKTSSKLAQTVINYRKSTQKCPTLGEMKQVLDETSNKNKIEDPLLKEFREKIEENWSGDLWGSTFRNWIRDITNNYRNKSAHPDHLSKEVADDCKSDVIKAINKLFEFKI